MDHQEVLFEGLTEDEILELPQDQMEGLILLGEPLVFRAGSATILGSFRIAGDKLVIELAQIDGGAKVFCFRSAHSHVATLSDMAFKPSSGSSTQFRAPSRI